MRSSAARPIRPGSLDPDEPTFSDAAAELAVPGDTPGDVLAVEPHDQLTGSGDRDQAADAVVASDAVQGRAGGVLQASAGLEQELQPARCGRLDERFALAGAGDRDRPVSVRAEAGQGRVTDPAAPLAGHPAGARGGSEVAIIIESDRKSVTE